MTADETVPAAVPRADWTPPPPVKPLRSVVGLSYAVIALLSLVAVLDVVAIYAALNSRAAIGDMIAGDVEDYEHYVEAGQRADMVMYFSSSLYLMALIATGVVFIVWFHRARTNAGVFAPDAQRRGPGWAIGSWFIPIANLWIPRKVAGDIWDASELDQRVPRTVLNAWWTLWVFSLAADRITSRLWDRAEEAEAIQQAALGLAASSALDIVAAVLAILFVRRLTAMQHAKALAGRPQEPATVTS